MSEGEAKGFPGDDGLLLGFIDDCPSRRLPVGRLSVWTFARHGKDVCPSRRLPVYCLPAWTFARQYARHAKDFPCKLFIYLSRP